MRLNDMYDARRAGPILKVGEVVRNIKEVLCVACESVLVYANILHIKHVNENSLHCVYMYV